MSRTDRTILLVEGDVGVAADLERILKFAGYTVIGPAGSVAEALVQIVQQNIDAAVLNIKVGPEKTQPVLDVLAFSGIPFLLVSACSSHTVVPSFRDRPFVSWPCPQARVLGQVEALLR